MPAGRSALSFEVEIQPEDPGLKAVSDVVLRLTFVNSADHSIAIYPGAAHFTSEAGWGSPTWHVEGAPLFSLRTYYGPPGQPPAEAYFLSHRTVLAPGGRHTHEVPGCFIPASRLTRENLSRGLLDPERMDGYQAPATNPAVLVLKKTCVAVQRDMQSRPDFLRPGSGLFLDRGERKLVWQYHQQPWMHFAPEQTLTVTGTISLVVPETRLSHDR